jgi:hypothetical protein
MTIHSSLHAASTRGFLFLLLSAALLAPSTNAQIGGQGTIQGTVTDPSGAVVPDADVSATLGTTGEVTHQKTTRAGFYSVGPLKPGVYSVTVNAAGFQAYTQENLTLDALQVFGLNVSLSVRRGNESITVTTAPPPLDTTNATLGTTMENETYQALPLNMGGAPRDPTAFIYLTPGVVSDNHYGQFNGGQSYHNETYIEGLAITDPAVQGNNQAINRGVSVDAVDQFQVQTAGTSAAYQGQGLANFTLKSGTNQFHGRAFEFFRNTVLDTWDYTSKNAINPVTGTTIKPVERQNEFGGTFGGPILKHKLFFFFSYDGQHYLKGSNPGQVSVPTDAERNGDFSALAPIYDPATTVCNGSSCTRQQFSYNGQPNVIPPSRFTQVAKFYQNFVPAATDKTKLVNNYVGGFNTGFTYSKYSIKFDYDQSSKNRVSFLYTYGNRAAKPACCDASGLPQPFTATVGNSQFNMLGVIEDTYTITGHWINQLKYGVSRGGGVSLNPGEGPQWAASASGITNIPSGQASDAAPRFGFSGPNPPASLGGIANSNNQGNSEYGTSYVLLDSMQYLRGRHSMSWGAQYQWLNDNDTSLTGGTYLNLNFSNNETGTFTTSNGKPTNTILSSSGAAYASFLIGAVDGGGISDSRQVITTGARYYTFSPFYQDDIKVTQKLTVNLGLRWDLYSPFHEVQNRLSFLDTTRVNPVTGTLGALNFAGNGTYGCNCSTPVRNWYKNFGPHLGFAYSVTPKTVVRGAFDIAYTHAGGVGGRGGGRQGTGQLGFSGGTSIASPDSGVTPGLYLTAANSYALPSYPQATPTPAFGTGYTTTAGYTGSPNGVSYADPYLSRRAPYYENFNFGIQQEVLKQTVLTVNYSGSNGHFLGTGIGHGIYSNQLDPAYQTVLGPAKLLTALATPANVAAAQALIPSFKLPFANFSPSATIGQALRPFAQYNSFSDVWGDMGNSNYNSLQITLAQKPRRGLSYTVNYTFSKLYDNTGTGRTAYGNNAYIERSLSSTDQPSNVSAYGVWEEPFGRGDGNRFVNLLIKNYAISAIYRYTSGYPILLTATGCSLVFSGTCMPSLNPAFTGSARINGGYGASTYTVATSTPYIDKNAFLTPSAYGAFSLGNSPRTYAYGLRDPGHGGADMSVRRTFGIYERLNFTFQADLFNITNSTKFGTPSAIVGNSNFGLIGSATSGRTAQMAARIDF